MEDYLRKIKSIVGEFANAGVLLHHEEYVNAILEGVPFDYVLVVLNKVHAFYY